MASCSRDRPVSERPASVRRCSIGPPARRPAEPSDTPPRSGSRSVLSPICFPPTWPETSEPTRTIGLHSSTAHVRAWPSGPATNVSSFSWMTWISSTTRRSRSCSRLTIDRTLFVVATVRAGRALPTVIDALVKDGHLATHQVTPLDADEITHTARCRPRRADRPRGRSPAGGAIGRQSPNTARARVERDG